MGVVVVRCDFNLGHSSHAWMRIDAYILNYSKVACRGLFSKGGSRGGGGPGGLDPPFVPRYRLFNIGPKIGPPSGPPFLLVDLIWTPLSKILDPPLFSEVY